MAARVERATRTEGATDGGEEDCVGFERDVLVDDGKARAGQDHRLREERKVACHQRRDGEEEGHHGERQSSRSLR